MSAEPDTYPHPEHGWTCFHCGDTFHSQAAARAHFGHTIDAEAGCVLKLTAEDRQLLRRIRALEIFNAELHADLHNDTTLSQHHASATRAELQGFKPFQQCSTVQDAFNVYDSMEGRALAEKEAANMLAESVGDALKLLRAIQRDLWDRAQEERDGKVVNISNTVWRRLCAAIGEPE